MMINLVFLPATEPSDGTYGEIPERIEGPLDASTHTVQYPNLVWYNSRVRDEAIAHIRAFNVSPVVLVGFSKSGLGAWNIARTIPDLVAGTIIFDAPVAREFMPLWGTGPFYEDDSSWQEDLPLHTIEEFHAVMPDTHQLVLISGTGFHGEMCQLSNGLTKIGSRHAFLSRPHLKHHWNSGWIEEGLTELVEQGYRGQTTYHRFSLAAMSLSALGRDSAGFDRSREENTGSPCKVHVPKPIESTGGNSQV